MLDDAGVYVHFPWCVRKCPYCDFNSHPTRKDVSFDAYVDALISDWQAQAARFEPPPFASVFLGGGTPSLFTPEQIERVLKLLPLTSDAEVTMEANPGTTEHARFADYRAAGINRLSLGAQSFDDERLKSLGRIHSADETRRAFAEARDAGFDNVNLDIMWGLPGQRPDAAMADLQAAIELAPEHVSWYQLTIEAKTEFARRTPILPIEDDLYEMEQAGFEILANEGYERYEVSAYARAGRRCRHNLNYWRFGDYLGLGAGAHGKVTLDDRANEIVRTHNASQPRLFQSDPTALTETPVPESERLTEFMMNALRLVEGTSVACFETHTGLKWQAILPLWGKLAAEGLVDSERPVTTAMGLRYLDGVLSRLLDAGR